MHLATLKERGRGPQHDGLSDRAGGALNGLRCSLLGEDLPMQVEQGTGEVVDWANRAERHGSVLAPQQVGAEHHSQVCVGHLVYLVLSRHLKQNSNRYTQQPLSSK